MNFSNKPEGFNPDPWAWRVLEAVFVLGVLGLLYMALCP